MEIVKNYIVPSISYDAGEAVGWGSLIGQVLGESWNGNKNNFDKAFANHEAAALETIKKWNDAWGAYTE
jgi:hypothetical protein